MPDFVPVASKWTRFNGLEEFASLDVNNTQLSFGGLMITGSRETFVKDLAGEDLAGEDLTGDSNFTSGFVLLFLHKIENKNLVCDWARSAEGDELCRALLVALQFELGKAGIIVALASLDHLNRISPFSARNLFQPSEPTSTTIDSLTKFDLMLKGQLSQDVSSVLGCSIRDAIFTCRRMAHDGHHIGHVLLEHRVGSHFSCHYSDSDRHDLHPDMTRIDLYFGLRFAQGRNHRQAYELASEDRV